MSTRLHRAAVLLTLVFGQLFVMVHVTAQYNESGYYPVYNFTPKIYQAHAQNFCAVQDQRGIIYFGNNNGILEYDGVNWNLIPPSNGSPVHSLAADEEGRIFFGSISEFGYLAPDSTGRLEYVLLSDLLDEENQEFNEVWKTHVINDRVIFQTYNHLFIWNGDSLKVIYSESEINESFLVGTRLFLSFKGSHLGFLEDDSIVSANRGESVAEGGRISGMIASGPSSLLIATESDGFFKLSYDGSNLESETVQKIESENNSLFESRDIYNIEKISANRISIGTWGYGAIIVDTLFNVIAIIDKEEGIQDEVVQGQFIDRSGNLWLALYNGLCRVETHSEITSYDDSRGIEGTVESIVRFNGRIYATTNVGLFYLDQEPYDDQVSNFHRSRFKPVKGMEMECFDMIPYRNGNDEVLLVITLDEVFELTKDHTLTSVLKDYSYKLYQSQEIPSLVFIGLENGLVRIRRISGIWSIEESFDEVTELVQDISEGTHGELWLASEYETVLRINFVGERGVGSGEYNIQKFGKSDGLPEGPFIFLPRDKELNLATNMGMFKFDSTKELFSPDSTFGKQFSDGSLYIHRISEFSTVGTYMVTYSETEKKQYNVGYLKQNEKGAFQFVDEPFARVSEELIHAIHKDNDGKVWLGGSQGIYRFDPATERNYNREFNAFLRTVETSRGVLIFGGAFPGNNNVQSLIQSETWKPSLPYASNSMVFNYAAQPSEDESFTSYSYFLEGNDEEWSEWTPETKGVYTNLHEGDYLFHVRAKNIYGQISKEGHYEFTILAPWFRTVWAYIIYVIVAALIIYEIVNVYTRRLRAIIRARTAEVVAQKEVIEEKNNDIMDSILYAEKIQRAMLPPEDDLTKLELDGFILFQPLNIVSGDFYWLGEKDGKVITVAADCTGHGVPGAFMSMLGVAFLNNIVGAQGIVTASEILNELRAEVIAALKQKGESGEQKDGMDLALHVIDKKEMTLEFAGANNPLILIRDGELIQLKSDRMPIGIHELADQPFQLQKMDLHKGDVIYTFSDGFQDQFGGPKNKKFMIKRLKELFLEIHQQSMDKQKEILEKTFYDWIVPYGADQIDDVIVIGIRI